MMSSWPLACFVFLLIIKDVQCLSQGYCSAMDASLRRYQGQAGLNMACHDQTSCTGLDCTSTYHFKNTLAGTVIQREVDFCHGIKLYPKKAGGSIMDMYLDVMEKNISWHRRFISNGPDYRQTTIPGAEYQFRMFNRVFATFGPYLDIYFHQSTTTLTVQIYIKIRITTMFGGQIDSRGLTRTLLNMTVALEDGDGPSSEVYHDYRCSIGPDLRTTNTPPKQPTGPPVTPKSKTHGKPCDPHNIKSCQEPEQCVYMYIVDKKDFYCQCPYGSSLPASGLCGPAGASTSYPVVPGAHTTPPTNSTNTGKDGGNSLAIALGVTVPILVIAIVAVVAFFIIRRRRNNPYVGRELLLTGDDDDDEPNI